jgi:transcriptional regulator with XRE-family HTH domain
MNNPVSSPLAAFVARRLDELQHRKSQKEVARAARITSPNFLAMIKNGTTKLPLDRVADLASALECDQDELMRLALRQFHGEELVNSIETALSGNEGPKGETTFRPGALVRKLESALQTFQAESAVLLQSLAEAERKAAQVQSAHSSISLRVQRLMIAAGRVLEQVGRARR